MTEIHERIREALALGPGLRLAILFGSRARGNARPDSDVDLAIIPADAALSLADENLLAANVERAAGVPVDLVRLDRAEAALKWRVARDAVVLVSDPRSEAARFLAGAGIEHDELRELELVAMRRYRSRLARGPTTTDVGLILRKLQRLSEQIALVRARRPAAADVLATDLVLRDALALVLMVALQKTIDIAYHVVADEGWGIPDSHRAAFELLAAHDVLGSELANRLSAAASMRNRIAHGYVSVEHARLWQELPEGLRALELFTAAIAAWLPDAP